MSYLSEENQSPRRKLRHLRADVMRIKMLPDSGREELAEMFDRYQRRLVQATEHPRNLSPNEIDELLDCYRDERNEVLDRFDGRER